MRHLFVTSVRRVFETIRLRIAEPYTPILEPFANETVAPLVVLLSNMADALKWSLVNFEADGGAHRDTPLPWISDILRCYEAAQKSQEEAYDDPLRAIPLTGDEAVRPVFFHVLRLLQACLERGLITPTNTPADDFALDGLLVILGNPELPPLPADLTLQSLAARQATHQIVRASPVSRLRPYSCQF